jgi:hypothetical protein
MVFSDDMIAPHDYDSWSVEVLVLHCCLSAGQPLHSDVLYEGCNIKNYYWISAYRLRIMK